jgi:S1-C subfamily serine protease
MNDDPSDVLDKGSAPHLDTHSDSVEVPKPARTGQSISIIVLVAALVGALLGGGLVALAGRNRGGTTINFGRNLALREGALDVQGVLAKTIPAVVSVQTDGFIQQDGFFGPTVQRVRGAGTGMVLSGNGDILTNNHVVEGAQKITVTFEGDKTARTADLIGADPNRDVAIIRVRDAHDLKTVTLGKSSDLSVGDDVLAIGNALALSGGNTVTRGIVSALDRSITDSSENLQHLIQTDAAINSGNSGGPLVDASGKVVGMNTIVIRGSGSGAPAESIGFAIAIDSIKPLIERLRAGQPAPGVAFLGVSTTNLTDQLKTELQVPVSDGAVVREVTAGSPAEQAGLQVGDVIVRFGGKAVADPTELVQLVQDKTPGDKVEVVFYRGDQRKTASVTVGSRGVRQ